MFKNYIWEPISKTPINLAVARVIFATYLIWKIISVDWQRIYIWEQVPGYQHQNLQNEHPDAYSTEMVIHLEFLVPDIILANVQYLQLIAVLLLIFFAIGYRIRFTAYASSIMVTYLGIIHAFVDHSWSTQILPISGIILLIFALYAEQDVLSHDGLRRHSKHGLDSLNIRLKTPLIGTYKSTPLSLLLLSLGVLYLGSGVGKFIQSGPQWVAPWNLGRLIHGGAGTSGYIPELGDLIVQSDILLIGGGAGTLIVEFGFILAIVTGKFFTVMILGLIAFHIAVALTMGPIFGYTVVLLLLLFNYERFIAIVQPTDEIIVKYNDNCRTSIEILYIFKHLDVRNRLQFRSDFNKLDEVPPDNRNAIYVDYNGTLYTDIAAIRLISKFTVILYPLLLTTKIPPLSILTYKLYHHFSEPRSNTKSSRSSHR